MSNNNKSKSFSDIIRDLENVHSDERSVCEKIAKISREFVLCRLHELNEQQGDRILDLSEKQFGVKRCFLFLMICDKTSPEDHFRASFGRKLSANLKRILNKETIAPGETTVSAFVEKCLREEKAKKEDKTLNTKTEKKTKDKETSPISIHPLVTWIRQGSSNNSEVKSPLDRMVAFYAYAKSCNIKEYNKITTHILKAMGVSGSIVKIDEFSSATLVRLGRLVYPIYEHCETINSALELALMRQKLLCEKTELERDDRDGKIKKRDELRQEELDRIHQLRERLSSEENKTKEYERKAESLRTKIKDMEGQIAELNSQVEESRRETVAATNMLKYETRKHESHFQSIYQGKLEDLVKELDFQFVRIKETLSRVAERERNSIERRINTLLKKLQEMKGAKDDENRD